MNELFSVIGYKSEEINTLTKRYQVFNLKHVVCDQSKPHEEEASPASEEEKASPAKKKKPRQQASEEEEASPAKKKKPRQLGRSSLTRQRSLTSEEFSPSIGKFPLTLTCWDLFKSFNSCRFLFLLVHSFY